MDTSENERYFKDEDAFIIQLDDQKIFKVKNAEKAFLYAKEYLLIIGD
jgi:hypothetical protein